jgi:hypothetical protein
MESIETRSSNFGGALWPGHDLVERLEKVRDGRIDEINQPGGWKYYLLGVVSSFLGEATLRAATRANPAFAEAWYNLCWMTRAVPKPPSNA